MQITITGKQINVGENMQAYAEKNLEAVVEKYFNSALDATVVFSREGEQIKADVTVRPQTGSLLKGSSMAGDAYISFDRACDRIARQLSKYKNRLKDHQTQKVELVDMSVLSSEENVEPVGTAPAIIAEMQTELPVCSVSGAVMRMDLADLPALMFRNSAHGGLNMVYRRPDGNIGWVDPKDKS